jgi:hypothetical protein
MVIYVKKGNIPITGRVKPKGATMKTIVRLLLFFIIISSPHLCWAADEKIGFEKVVIDGKTWTVPNYINIQAFPPLGGKLTARDARMLQLHQEFLAEGDWYVNELRERRTFEIIWIEKGTAVWVSNGYTRIARYLVSCGNRISFYVPPQVISPQQTKLAPQYSPEPAPPTLFRRFWNWLWYWPPSWPRLSVETNSNGRSTVQLF